MAPKHVQRTPFYEQGIYQIAWVLLNLHKCGAHATYHSCATRP